TILSIGIITAQIVNIHLPVDEIKLMIRNARIDKIILDIFLGFLLFAGAMHTDWESIKQEKRSIAIFALVGVLISTVLIAGMFSFITQMLGVQIDFIYCLLFGALISPTDPIAVLGILTKANVPKNTEIKIVGESLFNDGIGVVVFLSLLEALNSGAFSFSNFGMLFLQEAVGGTLMGLVFGYVLHILLKSIDHYETEILLTLAFVMGGYSLCSYLHISGPLAMVVCGLMAGNFRQDRIMSDITQEYVYKFWELVDVILNAILFIIIAFVIVEIEFNNPYILLGVLSIFIVLLSRIIIIYLPHLLAPKLLGLGDNEVKLIIWGGLRGGLSLALVLSLPDGEPKNILLVATYFCVLFSILVQGLTIEELAKKSK
ncbi:MAG: sodium:proton antiporter, partial [Saprospiraceae bacterium]